MIYWDQDHGSGGTEKTNEVGVSMKTILHEQRLSSVAAAVITLALGLVLVCWPDRSVNFLCMLLGVSIFITGMIYILGWLAKRKSGVPSFFVLPGVILCALGVWLMTSPDSVIMLIQYIFGAILIFHGLVDLQGVFALIRYRLSRWWVDLLLALATAGLGALILFNPFGTFAALVILIGAALIFDGVSDLYLIIRLSLAYKAAERQAEQEAQAAQAAEESSAQPEEDQESQA